MKVQKTLWMNIFCNDGEVTTKGPYDTEFAASAAIDMFGHIVSFPMTFEIEKPEPKKPKLLAPALYYTGTEWVLGRTLFESKKEAQEEHGDRQVIWPATHMGGFYEVPG